MKQALGTSRNSHRRFGILALAAVATLLGLMTPTTADAATLSGYQAVNDNSNRCMGVVGGSNVIGTPVVQWDCNGHGDQYWAGLIWPSNLPLNDNLVYNASINNRCLGTKNAMTGNGTPVVSVACNDRNWDQLWTQKSAGIYGYVGQAYVLVNKKSNRCLGVIGGSTGNGAQIVIWDCNGHHDQFWWQGQFGS